MFSRSATHILLHPEVYQNEVKLALSTLLRLAAKYGVTVADFSVGVSSRVKRALTEQHTLDVKNEKKEKKEKKEKNETSERADHASKSTKKESRKEHKRDPETRGATQADTSDRNKKDKKQKSGKKDRCLFSMIFSIQRP
jgi:hypothetical protein